MPELPDVEIYRRHLERTALRRTIAAVAVQEPRILDGVSARTLARRLKGARFEGTRRHGKHLLVGLSTGGWLTLHFGMTGSLHFFTDPAEDPAHDRVRFDFADGTRLAYVNVRLLGRVGLATDADAFIAAQGLGPDALDPALDLAAFRARLGGGRRSVKAALMDQSALAGIGNIYSDEILFQARLHSATRTDALDARAWARLYRAVRRVLETAVAREAGSEQFLDRLPRGYLLPRRLKGGHCPRCGAALEILKASGRTGYFCPACQPSQR